MTPPQTHTHTHTNRAASLQWQLRIWVPIYSRPDPSQSCHIRISSPDREIICMHHIPNTSRLLFCREAASPGSRQELGMCERQNIGSKKEKILCEHTATVIIMLEKRVSVADRTTSSSHAFLQLLLYGNSSTRGLGD